MSHFVSIRDGQTSATEADLANMAVAFISSGGGVVGTNDYLVQAQTSPDNTVKVGTGRAYVPTSDGTMVYSTLLDATQNVTIAANSSGSTQTDSVVLYIDLSASPDANASNVAKFADVRGSGGSAPTNAEILSEIGSSNPYVVLANISVANGFTSINSGNITDERTIVSLTTGQSVSVATYEEFTNQSGVVATPTTGKIRLYTKSSDKRVYMKDDAGTESRLTNPSELDDSNGVPAVKTNATASAVNEITVTNAATGTDPFVQASGSDTHINGKFLAKGNGVTAISGVLDSTYTHGIFIQAGITSATASGSQPQVTGSTTFTKAFKSGTTPHVQAQPNPGASAYVAPYYNVQIYGVSNTGFSFSMVSENQSTNLQNIAYAFDWLAVGEL